MDEYIKWKNDKLRLTREYEHRNFLKDCRYFRVTPKFFRQKNGFVMKEYRTDIIRLERRLPSKMIRKKESYIHRLKQDIEKEYRALKSKLNIEDLRKYEARVEILTKNKGK